MDDNRDQHDDSELDAALRQHFAPTTDESATNAAWTRVTGMIAKRESNPLKSVRQIPTWPTTVKRWAVAAVLFAVIAGTIATWPFGTPLRSRAIAPQIIASLPGQSRTVELADGSTVVLDAGSRIRVPLNFGRDARDLSLEGTAYFVVKHDASMPFRVHVRDGVIEDVGTRFVVEAYTELKQAIVSVAEGSVSLQGGSAQVALVAGDVGRIAASGADRIAQHVDVDNRVAWMHGELVFTDIPLADALPRLSRWYDRDVRLADSTLGARRLTARFRADQPADAVFDGVALALGARASHQGRVVMLTVAP